MRYLLLLVVFLVGCSVTPEEWKHAEEVCATNGGVSAVYRVGFSTEYWCNNGACFRE